MKRRLLIVGVTASVSTLLLAAPAMAQDEVTAEAVQVTLDNIWVLLAAVLGVAADRYRRHDTFHRSQAFMHKRWAELALVYPLGTSGNVVLEDLDLTADALVGEGRDQVLDISLPLEIPPEAYRDYRGFTFVFRDESLVALYPIGPDGPGRQIEISDRLRRKLQVLSTQQ